ncbi:alanine racemase [Candidatus Dependentiae bacterium]|nr:alanine racemase [Candidatus Dependentiae bacterium]
MARHKYPVWVEISKSALLNNIIQIKNNARKSVPNLKICGVVKSNAYGHGMSLVADIISNEVDWFAVNALWEAIQLVEKTGIEKPIVVLGYTPASALNDLVNYSNIRVIVYNIQTLETLKRLAVKYNKIFKVHIKVETGTGRQGITEKQLPRFILFFKENPNIILEGISTHYANIEDTTTHDYYQYQLSNYQKFIKILKDNGLQPPVKHTACTAACFLFPKTYFTLARPGIGLYGLWPSKETKLSCLLEGRETLNLQPALTFKTRIAQIKTFPANCYIGYGCTYRTTHWTRVAIIPVGYFDGYDRQLSNQAYVIIKNKRAPLIGRVCMNICMVDITHINNARLDDEVILLGRSKNESISADTIAGMCGTINYEIVTRINPVLPRIVVD